MALVLGLAGPQEKVRRAAVEALRRIDPRWKESPAAGRAVPQLLAKLQQQRGGRRESVSALGAIGPGAAEAVPALVERLADQSAEVREGARQALAQINPDWAQSEAARSATWSLVRRLIAAENGEAFQAAAVALGQIDSNWHRSEAAKKALPELIVCLADVSPGVRQAAREVVEKHLPRLVLIGGRARRLPPARHAVRRRRRGRPAGRRGRAVPHRPRLEGQ